MSGNPVFANNHKKYTREEEAELCEKMRTGDLDARDQLFNSCIPWTINISHRIAQNYYGKRIGDSKLDDLVQAGLCGLFECLKKFDPAKGRLTTYASWWVRKECLAWMWRDRTIFLPRYLSARKFKTLKTPSTMSLIITNENGYDITPKGLAYEHKDFQEVDDIDERDSLLKESIDILTERERGILFLRNKGVTLKEVGVRYGICRERVRQIQNRAIETLRIRLNQKEKGKSNGKAKNHKKESC